MQKGNWEVRFKTEEGKRSIMNSKPPSTGGKTNVPSEVRVEYCYDIIQTPAKGHRMESVDMLPDDDEIVPEGQLSVVKTDATDSASNGDATAVDENVNATDGSLVDDLLDKCVKKIEDHLRLVEIDVETAIDEAVATVDDDCAKMEAVIDEETEREIERIRARREERLNENREKTVVRQHSLEARRKELMNQIQSLGEDIRATLAKLRTGRFGSPVAKVNVSIDKLLSRNEKNGESGRLKKDAKSGDKKYLAGGVMSMAKRVTAIASNVLFVRENGANVGRVDGAKDRWVLEDEIDVAPIENPVLRGTISEDEVVIEDGKTSQIYVTNIRAGTTNLVIKDKLQLYNCVSQSGPEGVIVCGTRDGRVLLYDSSWTLVRRVTLPEKCHTMNEIICVAVDPKGELYLAKYGSHTIHVYNPSGNRWLRSIDVGDMVPIQGVHVLSSGIVVHSAMYGEQVCMLDMEGTQKTTVYLEESEDKCLSVLATHHQTDSIFNLSCDQATGRCVVEELQDLDNAEDGGMKRVLEFPAPQVANGTSGAQGLCLLEINKMVTSDGNRVLVFAKKQGVEHLPEIVP